MGKKPGSRGTGGLVLGSYIFECFCEEKRVDRMRDAHATDNKELNY